MKNEMGYRLTPENFRSWLRYIWCFCLEKLIKYCVNIIPKQIQIRLCVRFVVLKRSYSANTQPIWKQRYPTETWDSQVSVGYNRFQIGCVFVEYDLLNTTTFTQNFIYIDFRIIFTQFYINFSRQEHEIDVSFVSFKAWDSQVSS